MKIIIYIVLISLCWSCRQAESGFTVRGKIDGYPGKKLFVREMTPDNKAWMNDTLDVVNGEFVYKGTTETPRLVYFVPDNFQGRYELFLENAEIGLKAKYGDPASVVVSGSKSHDEFLSLQQKAAPMMYKYNQYRNRLSDAMKNNRATYTQLSDSTEIWARRLLDFIVQQPNYPQSTVLPYFASEWIKTDDISNMEEYLGGLTEQARASVYAQYCEKALQREKRILPGNTAYDFTLQDTSGKVYRLSDYRGKYVLLEFSASWCGWCKLEIPYLKQVYDVMRDKPFVMFTINLDKERRLWVDDVVKENLPWPVISDLKAFDSEVARQYNVSGIPMIFLIDPQGKIVTNRLRGEEMVRRLKAIG